MDINFTGIVFLYNIDNLAIFLFQVLNDELFEAVKVSLFLPSFTKYYNKKYLNLFIYRQTADLQK